MNDTYDDLVNRLITLYQGGSEDPMDGDETADLVNIVHAKIDFFQGNINEGEYLERINRCLSDRLQYTSRPFKPYVMYPVACNYMEAVRCLTNGGELWQEIGDEFPECLQIESAQDLDDILDGSHLDATWGIHMVLDKTETVEASFEL